ncbi:putative histone acetyltransferase type B catalytic subunit [Canna indica]|uniref:histone acetyltransferase n=1 Tax=Canna indica TaxID=4628 RepID=A0AAQ3KTX8_9LILI|nr:putative histone acetyltransferase type B catalytic subunit [Canna indica]
MPLKQKGSEDSAEAKKRRRVGFAEIDAGIKASECIKVFLVKSEDEVGSTNSFCISPVDLNQFFGEDGKIYGYKNLKVNVWLSLVSFHAYPEIIYDSTYDGGKGITDLNTALQDIFGETLIEKEHFLITFSRDRKFISNVISDGVIVPCNSLLVDDQSSNSSYHVDGSSVEVIRMKLNMLTVGFLYSHLLPLVLLLVDGGCRVDVTDPRWDIFLVVKKAKDPSSDCIATVLGFATVYHFFHYPDSTRLRIGQILVLPTYQGQGLGRHLLESVYSVAVSENMYDVTAEEPSDYLQYLRACIDTNRLLDFEPIKPAIDSVVSHLKEGNLSKQICKSRSNPSAKVIEVARQKFKINKKQFLGCWEVLVYLNLDPENKCMENFKVWVSERVKCDIVDKDAVGNKKQLIEVPNDYDHDMTFVVCWSTNGGSDDNGGNLEEVQATQEEQLNQLVNKRIDDIVKIAKKVASQKVRG